jgi:Nif-specific regulatory protein
VGAPPHEPAPAPADRLQAVLQVCQKLNSERNLEVLLDLIAREAARLMAAERASIFLLDADRNELWSQVALGSEPLRFDARRGIAGAAALTGETINVPDVTKDPRFFKDLDTAGGYQTRNLLAVPLRNHAGEITGAFEVLNRRVGQFTPDDEDLLRALAAQAGIAIETAELLRELERHRDRLAVENERLRKEVAGFTPRTLMGDSPKMKRVLRLVEQIRDSTVDVLVTGESGTGKELVARAIHYSSARAERPFVALNCAAIPENLVESELFGIEKGVATGVDAKIGRFEEADGGTLFLDEIGDLALAAQAKILRALQERVVERVGGRKPIRADVRVIAATNRNLEQEIEKGRFRSDLYYRLRVVHLETPALREIPEDLPLLANHFLRLACEQARRPPKTLSAGALRALQGYAWPGNARELENEMRRAVAVTPATLVTEDDLSDSIRRVAAAPRAALEGGSLKDQVEDLERRLIRDALARTEQNQLRAARLLGLSRQGLIKKMKRYGLGARGAGGA